MERFFSKEISEKRFFRAIHAASLVSTAENVRAVGTMRMNNATQETLPSGEGFLLQSAAAGEKP
jgi:hypothetical protein